MKISETHSMKEQMGITSTMTIYFFICLKTLTWLHPLQFLNSVILKN